MLWEAKESGTLETTFAEDGSILIQKLIKTENGGIKNRIDGILKEAELSDIKEKEYSEIRLKRHCPKCNEYKLVRYTDAYPTNNDIPVMPLYHCTKCKTRSYYLTDSYLAYLVENNMGLFSEPELSGLEKDKGAFMAELREHIIRIFASKRVMCIK